MKKITQNSYYLGLYDLDIVDYNDINGRNIYKKVDWRKSEEELKHFKKYKLEY